MGTSFGNNVSLYTRDPETNKFEISANLFHPELRSNVNFGFSVRMTGSHIYVGAPSVDFGSRNNVGAVYVYTKPFEGWQDMFEAKQIVPYDTLAYGLFGYSFETTYNTLIVGAPLAELKFESGEFTDIRDPGATYVIQGVTYDWSETIPFLKLQGESLNESDDYGASVALSDDYFFVGALGEDTDEGFNSGAVYTTEMPPLVQLAEPVCITSEVVDFFGYPYGGVWSGTGIIDEIEGFFDPKIAGEGVHLITYETPNCAYLGKLKIEVLPPLNVETISETNQLICDGNSAILELKAENAISHAWFYSPNGVDYEQLTSGGKEETFKYETKIAGYYYCEVSDEKCSTISETFLVEEVENELFLTSVDDVCDNKTINLQASPSGGFWLGEGVTRDGRFNSEELVNGEYTLQYVYTAESTCYDTASLTVNKSKIELNALKVDGDVFPFADHDNFIPIEICNSSDAVELGVDLQSNETVYWEFSKNPELGYQYLSEGASSINVAEDGYYRAVVELGGCSQSGLPLQLVYHQSDSIAVPNVITVNSDNKNDFFRPVIKDVEEAKMMIYNRSGRMIHSTDESALYWKSGDTPSGVYYWYLDVTTSCDNYKLKGSLHVLK